MPAKLRHILIGVCVLVIVACAAWAIADQVAIVKQQESDDTVRQLKPGARFSLFATACAEEAELPEVQADFADLLAVNKRAVGWITAGERIDEPVVQYDNTYYLSHDLYNKEDSNGVVFVNEYNTIWPRDKVILLHGHHMRNLGRFGTLTRFGDYDYVKLYPIVTFRTIYDPEDVCYVPIAGFNASMLEKEEGYFNIMQIGFDTDEEFLAYVDSLRARSAWKSPVDVNADDELLMMVTCSYTYIDGRFVFVSRKLRADETPEQMAELIRSQKNK